MSNSITEIFYDSDYKLYNKNTTIQDKIIISSDEKKQHLKNINNIKSNGMNITVTDDTPILAYNIKDDK